MRVWVTRASPGAERTADRLRALGHSPLLSPVMRIKQLPASIDLEGVVAIAFTSANGVEAFAVRSPRRDLKVFAVGDATAQAARRAGFEIVASAHGDVDALGKLIAAADLPKGAVVLHPGGRDLAGDLPAAAGEGVTIRAVTLYETAARAPSEALSVLDADGIDAVLVHSSKAARRVATVCAPWKEGRAWYLCLSRAVAQPLVDAGFEKVRWAPFPDDTALLKLLAERPAQAMTDARDDVIEEPEPYAPPGTLAAPPSRRLGRRSQMWGLGVVAVVAVAVAIGVAINAPKMFDREPVAAVPTDVEATDEARLQARIAELERQLAQAGAADSQGAGVANSNTDLAGIVARLDRLEQSQDRVRRAAAAAVAAAALADAAQSSRPFPTELAALERLMPEGQDLAGLRPLAETGAPTRSALAAEFPEVADRAAAASRTAGAETSLLSRIGNALAALITVRRTGDVTGAGPDAVLARAERRAAEGDIEAALSQLKSLPAGGQAATADWRERAQRRVEIERRIATLRTAALRDLAEAQVSGAAPAPSPAPRPAPPPGPTQGLTTGPTP